MKLSWGLFLYSAAVIVLTTALLHLFGFTNLGAILDSPQRSAFLKLGIFLLLLIAITSLVVGKASSRLVDDISRNINSESFEQIELSNYAVNHELRRLGGVINQLSNEVTVNRAKMDYAKLQLDAQTKGLEEVVKALPDMTFYMQSDTTILDYRANKTPELFAHSKRKIDSVVLGEEFVGNKMLDILPQKQADFLSAHIDTVSRIESPDTQFVSDWEYELKVQGERKVFEGRLTRLNESDALLLLVRDMTEKKRQSEEQLRSERKSVASKMVANVTHVFNNMLSVMMGYSELLKQSVGGNSKAAEYASKIYTAGEKAKQFSGQLSKNEDLVNQESKPNN